MSNRFNIIFMGTPEFAVTPLNALLEEGYNIAAVITSPDRPAGRGRKLTESAVKKFARERDLPILQPKNLKSKDFISELKSFKADLQVVVAFRMLPEIVWAMPTFGTINLHASLLPDYRGAAPINWVLINGENRTGVTTFFIDEKIDTGAIIDQKEVPIDPSDNAGTLHDKLMEAGAALLVRTVDSIRKGTAKSTVQDHSEELHQAPKLHTGMCRVNWHQKGDAVINFIRGLSPYPGAWSEIVEGDVLTKVKIFDAELKKDSNREEPGTITITKGEFNVAVRDGYIAIKSIQFPGKKRLPISEVLNGLRLEKNAHMV